MISPNSFIGQLYQLFLIPGVLTHDGRNYMGVKNLALQPFGSRKAQDLILLLRRTATKALETCRLTLSDRPIINFVPSSVTHWFEWESIAESFQSGQLDEACYSILLEWQQRIEQYHQDHYWLPEGEPVIDSLTILDDLANYSNTSPFSLEIILEKDALVETFLEVPQEVSAHIWYHPDSLQNAFDSFSDFLYYVSQAAKQPILFIFYQPIMLYNSNYFKILSLQSEQKEPLTQQINDFTLQRLNEHKLLQQKYQQERRPSLGERLNLPPTLLLSQDSHIPAQLSHPLFTHGPLRSLLLYTVLAWLAEQTTQEKNVTNFTLSSHTNSSFHIWLQFGMQDIRDTRGSIFESNDWQSLILPLARDIQRCAGNNALRTLWRQAVGSVLANERDLTTDKLFELLKTIRSEFIKLEKEQKSRSFVSL